MDNRQLSAELLGRAGSGSGSGMAVDRALPPTGPGRDSDRNGATVFTELVSRGPESRGREGPSAAHADMLHRALSQSLHAFVPQPGSGESRGAAPPRQGAPRELHGLAAPPMDWALRTAVRYTSDAPIRIVRDGMSADTPTVVAGTRGFSRADTAQLPKLEERYQQALLSWVYPSAPMEPAALGALERAGEAGKAVIAGRARGWTAAMTCLFRQVRCGACSAFYLTAPAGARTPFAVLFRAAGVAGRRRVHALVSRSTQGMRLLMAGPKYQLRFSMPLASVAVDPEGASRAEALPEDGTRAAREELAGSSKQDNKPQSLLFFDGMSQVAGLFDLLLNERAFLLGAQSDVPAILSPVVFEGATLSRAQPWLYTAQTSEVGNVVHKVEVSGLVAPWTADRLRACLQADAGAAGFKMTATPYAPSTNLNWLPDAPGADAPGAKGDGGALADGGGWCCEEEKARWMAAPADLEAGIITDLQYNAGEGHYSVAVVRPQGM
eukprot:jgi/Tetstr1/437188/TSEL_002759.t1